MKHMTTSGLSGTRVIAFESRRESELATLLRAKGAEVFTAPILREVPSGLSPAIEDFLCKAEAGEIDGIIALTGVSIRHLLKTATPERLLPILRRYPIAARGPKPVGVLREYGIEAAVRAPEPNTWRELLVEMQARAEKRWAVFEFGRPDLRLLEGLRGQGKEPLQVPVYTYSLPEDTQAAELALARLLAGEIDIVVFTSSAQIYCLEELADRSISRDALVQALSRAKLASIGPTMTETLEAMGLSVYMEASPPKMGILVHQLAAALTATAPVRTA